METKWLITIGLIYILIGTFIADIVIVDFDASWWLVVIFWPILIIAFGLATLGLYVMSLWNRYTRRR